jgi:hypothetical protein
MGHYLTQLIRLIRLVHIRKCGELAGINEEVVSKSYRGRKKYRN